MFALLMQLTQETGVAALVATHNPDLAARMDRKLTLRNGVLEEVLGSTLLISLGLSRGNKSMSSGGIFVHRNQAIAPPNPADSL